MVDMSNYLATKKPEKNNKELLNLIEVNSFIDNAKMGSLIKTIANQDKLVIKLNLSLIFSEYLMLTKRAEKDLFTLVKQVAVKQLPEQLYDLFINLGKNNPVTNTNLYPDLKGTIGVKVSKNVLSSGLDYLDVLSNPSIEVNGIDEDSFTIGKSNFTNSFDIEDGVFDKNTLLEYAEQFKERIFLDEYSFDLAIIRKLDDIEFFLMLDFDEKKLREGDSIAKFLIEDVIFDLFVYTLVVNTFQWIENNAYYYEAWLPFEKRQLN